MSADLQRVETILAWRDQGLTYREIGAKIGVTGERVRQITDIPPLAGAALHKRRMRKFWSRVDLMDGPDACWPWLGSKTPVGYGRLSWGYAHVIVLEDAHGPRPPGMVAMHSCDNPSCCNPKHLRWGTQKQNINDAMSRGRRPRGWQRPVLTGEIVQMAESGMTQKEIAAKFGVHQPAVSAALRRFRSLTEVR